MRQLHMQSLRLLVAKARDDGCEQLSQMTYSWDVSGRCERPIPIELYARPEAPLGRGDVIIGPGTEHALCLRMDVPCRKCYRCLRFRSYEWTARARIECAMAFRTWFGTLTLTPAEQYMALTTARLKSAQRGQDFDALEPAEQFRLRCAAISREITLFLKRVRKQSGAKLRVLVVAEKHKSGDPHWHLLIHETGPNAVRHRVLSEQWQLGHSKFKLIDDGAKAARYVCKYLTKSSEARVRASLRYGSLRPLDIAAKAAWENPTPTPLIDTVRKSGNGGSVQHRRF